MPGKYYWIKERYNPQLGTYYVRCGQITVKKAKKMENVLYGDNVMHKFSTVEEYRSKIKELKNCGEKVQ